MASRLEETTCETCGFETHHCVCQRNARTTLYETAVPLLPGVAILNVTPHPLTLLLPTGEVYSVPVSGFVVSAQPIETTAARLEGGVTLVRTTFISEAATAVRLQALSTLAEEAGETLVIVGSLIAAQAYPGLVVAMLPAPGYERVPPAEKRMLATRFTTYARTIPQPGPID